MKTARFSVLDDERGVLLGIDKQDVFKKGIVYEAVKVGEHIVIIEVGKSAFGSPGFMQNGADNSSVIYSGQHLVTPEEHAKLFSNSQFNYSTK